MEQSLPEPTPAPASPWIRAVFLLGLVPGFGLPVWATQHQDPPLRPHALFLAGLIAPLLAILSFLIGSRAIRSVRPWIWVLGYTALWIVVVVLVASPLTAKPVRVA